MESVSTLYQFADIEVDGRTLQVRRACLPVDLEPKAFRVLLHLIEHRDRVVSKQELIATVWHGAAVTDNSLTRAIALIRKQLGDNARAPHLIETSATAGYRFIAQLGAATPARVPRPWRWQIGAAAAAVIAIVAAAWAMRESTSPARVTRIQQFTSSAMADLWPSFSPDGSQIAFSSNRNGHFELYVQSLAPGSAERQVTRDWQDNIQPAWSPDGKYLAFVAKVRGGIGIVPVSGGTVRYLTASGSDPHWSPDGQTLVYRSTNLTTVREPLSWDGTVWLVGTDGSAPRQITRQGSPRGSHHFPRWLPDGRGILFVERTGAAATSLWVVDPHTLAVRRLNLPVEVVYYPTVTADGRFLYFVGAGTQGPLGVWRARLRGATAGVPQVVLAATGATPRDLTITPDGKRLALSQEEGISEIWSVGLDSHGVAVGEARNLTPSRNFRSSDPVFSADGSKFAYTQTRRGASVQAFVANPDGTESEAISAPGHNAVMPEWIGPDMVVGYRALGPGGNAYWIAPLGGTPRRLDLKTELKLDPKQLDRIRFSRDGTRALFQTGGVKGTRLAVIDRATLAVRYLTPADRNIGYGCWSPDGKSIAGEERVTGRSTVVVMPSDGGEIRTLVDDPVESWAHDWAPDNDRILFAGLRGGVWNVYWVSRSTGHTGQVTHYQSQSAFVRYPAWSPQGKQILFEHNELNANVFLADIQ